MSTSVGYLSPVPTYEDDLAAIQDIQEHPTADAAVKTRRSILDGEEVHHEAEFLYAPSTTDDADGKVCGVRDEPGPRRAGRVTKVS